MPNCWVLVFVLSLIPNIMRCQVLLGVHTLVKGCQLLPQGGYQRTTEDCRDHEGLVLWTSMAEVPVVEECEQLSACPKPLVSCQVRNEGKTKAQMPSGVPAGPEHQHPNLHHDQVSQTHQQVSWLVTRVTNRHGGHARVQTQNNIRSNASAACGMHLHGWDMNNNLHCRSDRFLQSARHNM